MFHRLFRWLALALLLSSSLAALASNDTEGRLLPNPNKVRVDAPDLFASANGKYRTLLRKLHVPADTGNYGLYSDFGIYHGNTYAGYNDLPDGYWVYHYPHWYIWRDCVNANAPAPPGAQPKRAVVDEVLPGVQGEIPLTN